MKEEEKLNLTLNELAGLLERIRLQGCRFASLEYRAKETGELARHNILLGISYQNALERDLRALQAIRPKTEAEKIALLETIEGKKNSLKCIEEKRENPEYTQAGIWETVLPGLRTRKDNGDCQLLGISLGKKVIEPGEFKPSNFRNEVTKHKAFLRNKVCKRIRTFSIEAENFLRAKIEGQIIVL